MAGFDDAEYERDFPRETVRTKAEIMIDEKWHDCVITNISSSGARLYVRLDVSRGRDVRIQIDRFGQFNATVAWCYGDEIGVTFDHDPAEMTNVLIGLSS
ncbi:MAG: PilZ domain-containing protein [Gallionella sp.]